MCRVLLPIGRTHAHAHKRSAPGEPATVPEGKHILHFAVASGTDGQAPPNANFMTFQQVFASGFLDARGERLLCTEAGQAFEALKSIQLII